MSTRTVSRSKYPMLVYRIVLVCLMLALCLPASGAQAATTSAMPGASPAASADDLTDPAELEAFLDGVINKQLEERHIPGATVSVVKDGRLFFAKGYGQADRERGVPVVAARTLFRFGSVGKLVTWTAVMQLVEQGKLDLHADVNTYLKDFQVPATYPQPVTLAHLLTHTAGFEDRPFGFLASDPAELQPLGPYLARHLPARVRPPGELVAYSNHGATLAGHIVERAAGMPFDEYVDAHILRPLGMRRSTFRQPVPPELAADVATGYTHQGGAYRAEPFPYLQIGPAGSLSATATDLAAFMIAHLQLGRHGDARILREDTARTMHRQQFTHHPRVSGMTYGFLELHRNDQRLLWHPGDSDLFHGALALLPEQQVGLVVSYNGAGSDGAAVELLHAFLDRYYPVPPAPAPTPAATQGQAQRFAGSYRGTRTGYANFLKFESLLKNVTVRAAEDGALVAGGLGFDPGSHRWVEVEPLVFRQVDGQERLAFRVDGEGRVTHLFVGSAPMWAYERLAWYETATFQLGLLVSCLLLFLSALLLWPLGALISRQRGIRTAAVWPRRARRVALALSALNVLFLVGFIVWYYGFYPAPYDVPAAVVALLAIPVLTTILAIASAVCAVPAWRERSWGVPGRVHYALVLLAALAFAWWLGYWNLLGFRL